MLEHRQDRTPRLWLSDVSKEFVLHLRGGLRLPIVAGVSFEVVAGECVALGGPSGTGKSSILKMIYGNYRADSGSIVIQGENSSVDIAGADARTIMQLRTSTMACVSQFLRVIPRVSCLDLVAAAAASGKRPNEQNYARARFLLSSLHLPQRLWDLPPATFSGGEQQRVNIACGFAPDLPLLLLDEPTASLDGENADAVAQLIEKSKASGTAIVGIFHDRSMRDRVSDKVVDVAAFTSREVQHA